MESDRSTEYTRRTLPYLGPAIRVPRRKGTDRAFGWGGEGERKREDSGEKADFTISPPNKHARGSVRTTV